MGGGGGNSQLGGTIPSSPHQGPTELLSVTQETSQEDFSINMTMNYKIAHDQVWTGQNICLRKLSEFYETQELAARLWQLLLHLGSSGNLPSCPLWLAGNTAGLLPQTINAGQCWQQSTLTLIFQSCPISVSDSSDGFSRFANPTSEDSW